MSDMVRQNADEKRYELEVPGGMAFADYVQRGDILFITHTEVPAHLQGQGLAGRLVKDMLADVRRRGLKVVPLCSYVEIYFKRHPEERDVLATEESASKGA